MTIIIYSAVSMAILGGLLGLLLAIASKMFYIYVDPRTDEINRALPQANCGACGYPGCRAYAEAMASIGNLDPALCLPGGPTAAQTIAKIMGVEAKDVIPKVAVLMCQGTHAIAKNKYLYEGPEDCNAAMSLAEGAKACPTGCLGLGSCVRVCPFDAMWMAEDGLVYIDRDKCTGCGNCVKICPKNILELIPRERTGKPKDIRVFVRCSNTQKGAVARKNCEAACIACFKCEKVCPVEGLAIHVQDNLAKVDYEKCTNCGKCIDECPTKCIEILPRKKKAEITA